jgi:hypothetical protein
MAAAVTVFYLRREESIVTAEEEGGGGRREGGRRSGVLIHCSASCSPAASDTVRRTAELALTTTWTYELIDPARRYTLSRAEAKRRQRQRQQQQQQSADITTTLQYLPLHYTTIILPYYRCPRRDSPAQALWDRSVYSTAL